MGSHGIANLTANHTTRECPSIPRFIYNFLRDNHSFELPVFSVWFSQHLGKVLPAFVSKEPETFYLRVHVNSEVADALYAFLSGLGSSDLAALRDASVSTSFSLHLCLGMIFKHKKKGYCTLICSNSAVVLIPMNDMQGLGDPCQILAGQFDAGGKGVDGAARFMLGTFFERNTPSQCTGEHKFWGRPVQQAGSSKKTNEDCTDQGDFDHEPRQKKTRTGPEGGQSAAGPASTSKPSQQASVSAGPASSKPVRKDLPADATKKKKKKKKRREHYEEEPPVEQPSQVVQPAIPPPAPQPAIPPPAPQAAIPPPAPQAAIPPPVVQPAIPPPVEQAAPQPVQPQVVPPMNQNKLKLAKSRLHQGFDPEHLAKTRSPALAYVTELCMRALRESDPVAFNELLHRLPPAPCPEEVAPPPPAPVVVEVMPVLPDPMESFEVFAGQGQEAHLKAICDEFHKAIGCKIPDESQKPFHLDLFDNHTDEKCSLVFTWRTTEPVLPPTLGDLAKESRINLKHQLISIVIDGFGRSSYLVWIFLTGAKKCPAFARDQYKGAITVLKAMGRELLPLLHTYGLEFLRSGGLFDPVERKYKPLDEMKHFMEIAPDELKEEYYHAVAKYCEPRDGVPEQFLGLSLARRLGFNEIRTKPAFVDTARRMRHLARAWYERDQRADPGPILPLFFPEGFAVRAKTLKPNEQPAPAASDAHLDPFAPPA